MTGSLRPGGRAQAGLRVRVRLSRCRPGLTNPGLGLGVVKVVSTPKSLKNCVKFEFFQGLLKTPKFSKA